jgi:hypothetical protein
LEDIAVGATAVCLDCGYYGFAEPEQRSVDADENRD